MAREWCIEATLGKKWLSPWGWMSGIQQAMRFRFEGEAKEYIQANKVDGVPVQEDFADPVRVALGMETEYDPYGHKARR